MEEKKTNWFKWPLEHYPISLLIIALLFVMGIYGMRQMPKDEFPAATIRQGVVAAVYPGATSEEVEVQVAKPLERYLFTFKEVLRAKTTSTSQNGMCIVMVRLKDDVNNKDEVWSKIKHGLQSFKQSLPSGVLALVTNDDFGNTSALLISVESSQRSYRELQEYTDKLSDNLRRIPSVANVRTFGQRQEQISVYVDRQRLQAYGIGQQMLLNALKTQNLTTVSGSITGTSQVTPIHIEPSENSEKEIEELIVFSDPSTGKTVRVRDIARVVREYDNNSSYISQDGHPCILLSMEMNLGNNIVEYGKEVDKVISDFRNEELPEDVVITRIADQPKVVGKSVRDFLRDLLISMAVIILVMMVLFPLRSAIVAAITIPLSTFISVAIMYLAGIELNIVTLAALIVVMGMVVDNSIVVIDGYLEYIGNGQSPKEAALSSVRQYFMPMMLATLCICVIFYPLLVTMTGAFHDALEDFPVTITINLMMSLFLAVLLIPFLETKIMTPDKISTKGNAVTKTVQSLYEKVLGFTFRMPYVTIIGGIAIILLSCLLIPKLKIRMFPFADRDQFAVEIFLPEGKGLEDTRFVADSLRKALQKDKKVKCITSFIGCSSPRFMICYAPQMAGRNFAQLIVNTKSDKATIELLNKYQNAFSESFPQAYIRFKRLDYLEVQELEYRFYGEDIDSLQTAADQLMDRMRQMPELEWVHTDYFQPYPVANITLDPVASSLAGINRTVASIELAANTSDIQAGEIWEDDYQVPVIIKDASALTISGLGDIGISTLPTLLSGVSTGSNSTVPLRQIAKVEPKWSHSRINHRQGERCMTVTAQFAQGTYAGPVEKKLRRVMEKEISVPQGVRTETGGELEYDNEALPQIVGGVLIAMIIIFFFLLFNFKKFGITSVCIAALALMIPGTLIGLALLNRLLGLTSILGVITLMGMIMRNQILIYEHANSLVAKYADEHPDWRNDKASYNQAVKQAAYDAGKRRMVPIFLTTATTAVGVVPMIIAGSSFWMPVGVTIFAGGIGSLIMVVTMLPVIYWKVNLK